MPAASTDPSDDVLVVENVSKRFTVAKKVVPALDDVNFRVARGKVTGLIGPDGAGKTTILRLSAGLLKPDSGHIRVLGIDAINNPLAVQQSIGYMPQRFGLYEDLTVQENLDLYADLQGLPKKQRAERYQELMHMTGLGSFTKRYAGALSGGMKQKLGLACTLVRPPRLLLLDEATVGVDPVSRRELWSIIYRLVEKEGVTVLLSTAYLDEAERCHQVILMHNGSVLGEQSPQKFSDEVSGRSFQVTAPGMNKRTLQTRLRKVPGIIDAIIQGDGVRIVTDGERDPDVEDLLPDQPEARLESMPARFEDAFIVRLRQTADHETQPTLNTAAAKKTNGDGQDVISVQDVKRRFGDFYAVKGISFTVKSGEVFGLLGANGAGKSTTFRMLCGLLPPTAGTLQVAGQDLMRAAAKARTHIGYMAQRFSLYGDLSVKENLRFFSNAYGLYGKQQRERMDWAIEQFELTPYINTTSRDLPLGFKQRLAMSAALMHAPEILFLDEPTSGVDPLARREFWHRISALSEQGVTVLVTTHFMEEAEYCDRLVMMAEGEILAQGTPAEMKDRFRTDDQPEPTMEDAFIGLLEAREEGTS